ncbi:uncharacterized protein LOC144411894 [Styela clava]
MLNSYFEICLKDDGSTIFDIAYVLDARYKTKSMKRFASRKVKNLLQFEVENIYTSEIEQPAVQQSGMATELHERNNKSCIENLINDGMDSSEESGGDVGELTREMEVSAEISKYLNDRYLGLSATQEEMLQWWKRNKKVYPNIAVVVQKYLCIPATSAASERAFSSAGLTVSKLRSRLTGRHVNELNFLHCNRFLL